MGHTDVVPVSVDGWRHDPFGGELIDGEVWGRGAVDMLNLTSSMAVVFRSLAERGFRPRGDLVYFAVADEEAGSVHGARWVADHHPESIRTTYLLTESGGLHTGSPEAPQIGVTVAEKGVAWRRLRVRGTPGHGSMPFRIDNALIAAAGRRATPRRLPARPAVPRAVAGPGRRAGLRRRAEAGTPRPGSHRRRPRRDAVGRDGDTPARVHAHHVLAERGGRWADEDQRDPRRHRPRRRRAHAARRGR